MKRKTKTRHSGECEVCCHRVAFWYDLDEMNITDEILSEMSDEAERRSAEMIAQGYHAGELCAMVDECEFFGWWKIERD